jgi:hypothetical protein
MNAREIEHLWKVASNDPNHDTNWHDPVVVKFAELVAAAKCEELAKQIEVMPFGNTAASFATWVRDQK